MWRIICIFLFLPGSVLSRPRCGGVFTEARGIIQSPNFPNKFNVPIHCEWIIDAQHMGSINSSIYVYFTQLFLFEGLSFKEYQIYDQSYQLNGREIHQVTENNVTKVSYIESKQGYLVITLKLDAIESTHLRVLDHLLDVYGFNITYEISSGPPRADRCTMLNCGFTGTCYDHFTRFSCDCFEGYEGPKCSKGPHSLCNSQTCKNGGTCMHIGDLTVRCECRNGFTGEHCELQDLPPMKDCENCFVTCPMEIENVNPCKCPEGRNSTQNDVEVRYEAEFKLINVPSLKTTQQKFYVENHLTKIMKEVFPTMEDIQLDQFESLPTHIELSLVMTGYKRDERRFKSVMGKWSDRGHIGNLTLAPHSSIGTTQHEYTIQNISIQPSGLIHAGEDFILSCSTRGSSASFRWFKDGLFVNVTSPTSNKWSKVIEDPEVKDQYTSLLGIKNASPFDQGTFTCQIVENAVQKCLSKRVDIKVSPRVWIEPMSLTVRKGENFTIKCFSNNKHKYTYSWTKNRELMPIKTEYEHYEVLFPMGSILQVSKINKSTVFSCLVQDAASWAEQSILVNVIDTELVKTCQGEKHLKLLWPETAPGTESLQECPSEYVGVARRTCILQDAGQPSWHLPDFSGCTNNKILSFYVDKVRLGYSGTNPIAILQSYKKYLEDNKTLILPGEGSRILSLVYDVVLFMNNSISAEATYIVLDIIDQVLQHNLSIINQTQVILLQQVVKRQNMAFQSNFHHALSAVDVTLTSSSDKTGFHVPLPAQSSYPAWYSYKLHLALPQHFFASPNKSATLAVVVYRNLSAFLPQRSAIRLKDGIEMDYEVISKIAASWLKINGVEVSGNLSDALFTMEFNHHIKNTTQDSWKILCAIADFASYGYSWDIQTCITKNLDNTRTRCLCPRTGTYAVLLTMKPSYIEIEGPPVKQLIILIGCSICTLLTVLSTFVLCFYWIYQRSCLVFLKIQCCISLLGAMIVFIYAICVDVTAGAFLTVMSFLEAFVLTGMSTQLSNLLIIYSELVQLPTMRNIKQTVVIIITGAPMIAVVGNYMAHLTMNTKIHSWWLLHGSLSFNIFVTCCIIIIILYFLLFYIVYRKVLHIMKKYEKAIDVLRNRLNLLKRSIFVFTSITATVISSIFYINASDNILYHYTFSLFSTTSGIIIFFCYILYSETPIKQLLIIRFKDKNNEKQSPDASKHLKFFTKQKGEVENESTPYFSKATAETHFMHEAMCKQKLSEIGSTSFKTYASANFIENQDITAAAHTSKASHELQFYDGSPKQFVHREIINSPDLLGTKKFVQLDLVASSIQQSTEDTTTSFYGKTLKCNSILTNIQQNVTSVVQTEVVEHPENCSERQRPDGEEKITQSEVIPIISIKELKKPDGKVDDNLDAVIDSIKHDLNYLLNDEEFDDNNESNKVNNATSTTATSNNPPAIRRISRPPSQSVFEQITEETEDEIKVPDAITDLSRTVC